MSRSRRRRRRVVAEPVAISIDSLSHDGRGVGRDEQGKVVFADYALPGEEVMFKALESRKSYTSGTAIEVLKPSEHRVTPKCEVFGECGGCILQHLDEDVQITFKQQQLLENLEKIGKVTPEIVPAPLVGERWQYRRRARLGAKYVPKKGGMIIGFRERNSSFIQPTERCEVLRPEVADVLPALRDCLASLSCQDRIPQIEVAVADNRTALVIRHLDTFLQTDLDALTEFAKTHDIDVYLQPGNLKSVHALYPEFPEPLHYDLPEFDIEVEFLPTDFIQVNGDINNRLIDQALSMLELEKSDRVLDLFCGVGNFTLPIARRAAQVIGVEGDKMLVERANHNKKRNQLDNVEFFFGDLFKEDMSTESHGDWLQQEFDKILIDPPRSGADEILKRLPQFNARKIVYVSCNPATLARDAGVMVNELGYRLVKAGVIDMFPHTAHVESIALFEKH